MDASITIRLSALERTTRDESRVASRSEPQVPEREVSDETLMARVGGGSREALAVLFRRYARLVRALAFRILRDSFEADDCLQDVFLFVHRKGATFDSSRCSARSWLVQMTYQRAIDRRRYLSSRHFYTCLSLDSEAGEAPDPRTEMAHCDRALDTAVESARLQKMFASLSEDQKRTLRLFFFEGQTFEEIASALNQSVGNIKNHYYRGLERLRKQIFGTKAGKPQVLGRR